MKNEFDVLIIGGVAAGLSAALALGRMSRTALVCDDGRPRNAPAAHMNNFPGRDGIPPPQWRAEVREDLKKYSTVQFFSGAVESLVQTQNGFQAKLSSGQISNFRKVVLAHGIIDQLPKISGMKELWGKSIFLCPFCHGYEVRGKRLGLLANGEMAARMLPMIYSLSNQLTLFTNGAANLSAETRSSLKKNQVTLIEENIEALIHSDEQLTAIKLANGQSLELDFLFMTPQFPVQLKSTLGENLGCEKTDLGHYRVTEKNESTVKGVFAAGDIMTPMQSVLSAAASGTMAGAAAVHDLVAEDFQRS